MVYAILILFVVFMAFIASWAAAKRFQEIADMKGHNGGGLFLVVLLAGTLRMGYGHGSAGQTKWTGRSRSPER